MRGLREKHERVLNDLVYGSPALMESAANTLALDYPFLAEMYRDGRLGVLAKFISHDRPNSEICAYFQRHGLDERIDEGHPCINFIVNSLLFPQLLDVSNNGCLHGSYSDNQEPVFVSVVDSVQDSEGFIPSDIWLMPFQELDNLIPCQIHVSITEGCIKYIGTKYNRECDSVFALTLGSQDSRQFTSQIVETAPKVVSRVANDEANLGRWGFKRSELVQIAESIGLLFEGGGIGFRTPILLDGAIELFDVFVGPVKFVDYLGESGGMCYHDGSMTKSKDSTQKTPQGHEIPVPKREDFFSDLEKASEPEKKTSSPARRSKKKGKKR